MHWHHSNIKSVGTALLWLKISLIPISPLSFFFVQLQQDRCRIKQFAFLRFATIGFRNDLIWNYWTQINFSTNRDLVSDKNFMFFSQITLNFLNSNLHPRFSDFCLPV